MALKSIPEWTVPAQDPAQDAAEIARLRSRVADLEAQVELLKRPPSSDFTTLHVSAKDLTSVENTATLHRDHSSDTKRYWEGSGSGSPVPPLFTWPGMVEFSRLSKSINFTWLSRLLRR